ncbi:hypothetical protein WMY93_005560 [Mugilogobius chulae]|uniref:DDE Tnp4 domain-containing protein n=1 Tax=Mugilogobius chulae TaxID=88201 RepID=A0AAW0PHE9_9GOBI
MAAMSESSLQATASSTSMSVFLDQSTILGCSATALLPPPGPFIPADGGYPCLQPPLPLITPYKRPVQGVRAQRFNYHHSRARSLIERAFGVMKTRFRAIFFHALEVIAVCAILHNICLEAGDIMAPEVEPEHNVVECDCEVDALAGAVARPARHGSRLLPQTQLSKPAYARCDGQWIDTLLNVPLTSQKKGLDKSPHPCCRSWLREFVCTAINSLLTPSQDRGAVEGLCPNTSSIKTNQVQVSAVAFPVTP